MATKANCKDTFGTLWARIGITRNSYKVSPGLYAVGSPNPDSPVLVTANFKLSFDSLRFELAGIDAWLLVLDTRGVNVWCAAGKKTFSTEEILYSVKKYKLAELVSHRELIVPQLGATGVSATKVKKACGFKVKYGPVRAADLPVFLHNANKADEAMRTVIFNMTDRAVLIPVELYLVAKPLAVVAMICFLLSGIGPGIFSLNAAWDRGLLMFFATVLGIVGGAVMTPLLLPWLPGRQFWLKGLLPGFLAGIALLWRLDDLQMNLAGLALLLWTTVVSSYLAMNFTGATPYTSPTGVEFEMRRGIPVQLAATVLTLVLWMASPFYV